MKGVAFKVDFQHVEHGPVGLYRYFISGCKLWHLAEPDFGPCVNRIATRMLLIPQSCNLQSTILPLEASRGGFFWWHACPLVAGINSTRGRLQTFDDQQWVDGHCSVPANPIPKRIRRAKKLTRADSTLKHTNMGNPNYTTSVSHAGWGYERTISPCNFFFFGEVGARKEQREFFFFFWQIKSLMVVETWREPVSAEKVPTAKLCHSSFLSSISATINKVNHVWLGLAKRFKRTCD